LIVHTAVARLVAVLVVSVSLALPSACAAPEPQQRVTHKGRGTVVAVNLEKSRIKLDHEKIEGYMDPMVMWFDVKDASLIRDLAPNDRVEFTVTEEDAADVITEIHKI
jgi:Cu/Ag efflux protein CusF